MRVNSIKFVTLVACALFLSACNTASAPPTDATTDGSGSDPVAAPVNAASTGAPENAARAEPFVQNETAGGDNGRFEFTYSWPAAVSVIPALAARLDAERKAAYAKWRGEWDQAQGDSPPDCVPCRSRGYEKEWKVVADLPRWLSLSASVYSYTGRAHGGTVFDALVWDREGGKWVKPVDMFRSPGAIDEVTQAAFCRELDKMRERRRGTKVVRSGDPFNDCIAPVANSTVIVGSASGRAFDRIGFLVPAYNAGPYAEGPYDITVPVTPALLDAVRPEYRRAFQVP
ncbi:hypothetical protein EKN06_10435 [Croceicoccus ponticola]|uniref:Deacetylase PdaC domain-containing protein n=1 Tax=Croceicoccus ponticola TaxID=2217664 RepID=A0A437GWG5_9SPHN|nr:DUF4163 domain-containing protein [Croceicoccus ponticola]RVQ66434.1 hypothetical protein EKN06_10435 [Croceicoccus ponticola]